ncbi:autotransporter outer membrane beta-barrel domain-containing protein, partial [Roseobacter sp. HKCCD8749]|uniref:autotransporter outer membrane beta-barrel domain-containing protein n=1 Tax=Roseobacter sp. HKCCD8749 TaxID=2690598 RepID=UPI0014911C02
MTKFKGRVASIAPGLSVVATATVLFAGSVDQAAAQQAADACGTPNNGKVTCDADNYTNGITYNTSNDLTLELDRSGITVNGSGVQVNGTDTANVKVHMTDGKVTTNRHGVSAFTTGSGSVHAQLDGLTSDDGLTSLSDDDITINRNASVGLRARIGNTASSAEARAVMTGGKITIAAGHNVDGVAAFTHGSSGVVTAEMSGGLIITEQTAGAAAAVYAGAHETFYVGTVTAEMSEADSEIHTKNHDGLGLRATTRATSEATFAVAHMRGGKITTEGNDAYAVVAAYGGNPPTDAVQRRLIESNMTAKMTGGTIETFLNSTAIVARTPGVGDALAEMDETDGPSQITTHGNQAHGLRVESGSDYSQSEGTATAIMRAGRIIINGPNSSGASAQANGGLGMALVRMEGGRITMSGANSYGLYARIDNPDHTNNSDNTNGVKVEMIEGDILGGAGPGSHGILADTSGAGRVTVEMQRGTVITRGSGSHGIWAESEAQANSVGVRTEAGLASGSRAEAFVTVGAHANVTALGSGSDGIRVSGNYVTVSNTDLTKFWLGAKGFEIEVAGSVTGGSGGGAAAIRTLSSDPGTITIDSGARVIAGDPGIAIHTVTAGADGPVTEDDDGSATITSEGTIIGDIRLEAGDDTLIVTGGSIIGDVYGGEGDNTLTLEDGLLAGNIRLGAGDDSFTIASAANFDFSHVLDGGSGDNDHLTLHGRTMTSMGNVRNWEHLTLNDTHLSLDGMDRLDMGLSIDATSTFSASGGSRSTGATTAGKVANVPGGGITIAGDVTNAGEVTLSVQDGAAGDVIRVEGNYTNTGSGRSVFELDAVMGADGANTDRLEITGNASGEIGLSLAGLDSASAGGAPLAIYVVSVGGASDDATFTLMDGNYVTSDGEQAMISGAYLYRLAEVEAQDGRNWWALSARSESGEVSWGPSAPIHDSYGASLLAFNAPSALRGRGSSQDFRTLAWGGAGADAAGQDTGAPLWIQMGTEQLTSAAEQSTTGAARDSSLWEMEIGADLVLSESAAGLFVGGLMLSYGTGSTDVSSGFGDGSIETTGLGLGLAATWYDTRGFYVDGQVTVTSYSSDL